MRDDFTMECMLCIGKLIDHHACIRSKHYVSFPKYNAYMTVSMSGGIITVGRSSGGWESFVFETDVCDPSFDPETIKLRVLEILERMFGQDARMWEDLHGMEPNEADLAKEIYGIYRG
jgi:hypothetical protein